MSILSDLIAYYVNLLIIQYHDKPKAQATIALYADALLANNIMDDIQNAYSVETAVGKQLDVIGKYVGVSRYYSELVLENYFSLVEYTESIPSSPPRWGFCDYTNYDDFAYNGTLTYNDIITSANALFDEDYRTIIKLKIILNYSNFSTKEITEAINDLLGPDVRFESAGNMTIQYFISQDSTPVIQAILSKKLLPAPMGVLLTPVIDVRDLMFAFTDYSGYETPFGYGFSTYADYDSLSGQVLTYDQIIED